MANDEPEDLNLEAEAEPLADAKPAKKGGDKSKIILLFVCILASIAMTSITFFVMAKLRPAPAPLPATQAPAAEGAEKTEEDKKVKKKRPKAKAAEGEGKAEGGEGGGAAIDPDAPGYVAIDPAFVVNFQTQLYVRGPKFLQVQVVLMSHNHDALDDAQNNLPLIKNALVGLFSSKTLNQLNTAEAKEALRKEALELVKTTLKSANMDDGIEDVLFNSFVMQ